MLLTLSTVMAIAYSLHLPIHQLFVADTTQVLPRRLSTPLLHNVTIPTPAHLNHRNGRPSRHLPDRHHPRRRRDSLQRQRGSSCALARKATAPPTTSRCPMASLPEPTAPQTRRTRPSPHAWPCFARQHHSRSRHPPLNRPSTHPHRTRQNRYPRSPPFPPIHLNLSRPLNHPPTTTSRNPPLP